MTGCEEINTKEISRILMTDYKGSRVWACTGAMKTKFHTKSVLPLTVISKLLTIEMLWQGFSNEVLTAQL